MQCQPTKQLNPKWSLNVTTMRTNSWQQTTKSTIPSIFEFKQSPIEIPTEKELFCYWKHSKTFEGRLKKVGAASHTSGMNLQRWKGANLQWGETSRYIVTFVTFVTKHDKEVLTLYTIISVCIFSMLFIIHFLRC